MSTAKMTLLELVKEEADTYLVGEMLAFAAERMMGLEVEAKIGAPVDTRSSASSERSCSSKTTNGRCRAAT